MKMPKSKSIGTNLAGAFALAAGTVMVAKLIRGVWARATVSFTHKAVLITGGSRGLGLAMARRFAQEGARVAIAARDSAELKTAADDLQRRGAERVLTVVCDLRDRAAISAMIDTVANEFGRIDVLVNNAGIMVIGPFENLGMEDFEASLDLHFWAPLLAVQAALPHMPKNGTGRIVNISSIGGRIAPPHLAAYCAGKFATTGISDAMGAELAAKRIPVSTVLPGLMRTGSYVHAQTRGQQALEFSWFSIAAALPVASMNTGRAARQIVEGCRQGRRRVIVHWETRLAVLAEAILPEVTLRALSLVARFLPKPVGAPVQPIPSGVWRKQAEPQRQPPRWLAWLTGQAETVYNELRGERR